MRIGSHQVAKLQHMVENTRQRLLDLKHSQKTVDRSYNSLQVLIHSFLSSLILSSFFFQTQYQKAQHDMNETYNFYRQLIEERKHDLIKVNPFLFDRH